MLILKVGTPLTVSTNLIVIVALSFLLPNTCLIKNGPNFMTSPLFLDKQSATLNCTNFEALELYNICQDMMIIALNCQHPNLIATNVNILKSNNYVLLSDSCRQDYSNSKDEGNQNSKNF